jgi:DNA helicase-2/ATP-dependent DNA helicase PcrA
MSTFVLSEAGNGPARHIAYEQELNQEQLDVVLHADGACLVLAGAGSGKTRTLTYRVAHLLERGEAPERILLLTFTNKAAREMLSRVESLVGPMASGIMGGTFHSVANRLLRKGAKRLGYEPSFSILDAEDTRDLLKAVMKDLQIDPKARRFPSTAVVQDILSLARNTQTSIPDVLEWKYPSFQDLVSDLEEVARQFHLRKKQANVMDFDDLLTNLALLLQDPEVGPVLSERYRYVLVDEYQDTNAIQAKLVSAFAAKHENVLAVGDDAQSIYAFRGADVENILNFPKQWSHARIFKLLTNYRSTTEILSVANESLSHNTNQFEKELVGCAGSGDKPKLIPCSTASQEARYIAEQVLALRAEGTALPNIAVLFRSGAHSQALEFELAKRDIPYEYRGGQKFFERAHIKDVLAYLRVLENPKDEVAWLRILGMQQGIGAATATELARYASNTGTLEPVLSAEPGRLPSRARGGWETFVGIMGAALGHGRLPAGLVRTISASAYQEYLEREYPNWRERLEDLEQLALFAEGYEDLSPFLADLSLYEDIAAGRQETVANTADQERMVLSTIHQAKGLEWDSVFVMHLADNAFPHSRAMGEEGGLEEERRLFYVAVTRARRRLFLSYPMTMGHDALTFHQPSVFLDELHPSLFERVELRESTSSYRPQSSGSRFQDSGDGWSWDEPSISVDRDGERRPSTATPTAWKSSTKPAAIPPKSFLRDV